jgi:GNAT superfamily N-acetyltransferase
MTVRRATGEDRGAVLSMAWRFLEESQYRGLVTGSVAHLEKLIDVLLEGGVIFVAEEAADVVGMIAGVTQTHPITGEVTATEFAWWVEPEFRGSSAGGRLLKAFEGWARFQRASVIQMIAPAGAGELEQFYERRGYEEVETTFQLRLAA